MRLVLLCLALLAPARAAKSYTSVGVGACRGNGGVNDKVNNKYVYGETKENCEAECDAEDDCVGYGYSVSQNGGACMIHGPNVAGSCSDTGLNTAEKCASKGSCSDPDSSSCTADGLHCVGIKDQCENAGFVWTATPGTWTGPTDPWIADSHATTHIHDSVGTEDGYECFDIDLADHQETCTGTCSDCTVDCATDFANADDFLAASCPDGCTWTAAPKMEKVIVSHVPSVFPHGSDGDYMAGMSGACRRPDGAAVTGKYSNSCDIDGLPKSCVEDGTVCSMTQEECKAGCDAENALVPGSCNAYHHGPWCQVFGPDMGTGLGTEEGGCWVANVQSGVGADGIVTGTKHNPSYLCWKKCGAGGNPEPGSAECPYAEDEEEDKEDKDKDGTGSATWSVTVGLIAVMVVLSV
jgi:hypothetical protein